MHERLAASPSTDPAVDVSHWIYTPESDVDCAHWKLADPVVTTASTADQAIANNKELILT